MRNDFIGLHTYYAYTRLGLLSVQLYVCGLEYNTMVWPHGHLYANL